jgi:Fe-S cluster assembly protein SufD
MPQQATRATGFTQESFESFLATRDEPAWSLERRRAAWEAFQQMDWPARNHEEWTRTDIRTFRLDRFKLPSAESPAGEVPPALLTADVQLGGALASLDSRSVAATLEDSLRRKGVIFDSLDRAVAAHEPLVKRYLSTAVDENYDRFSALAAACWSGGTFLYVPRGVAVDLPLHALAALSPSKSDFSHVLVVLEDGAEATLMTETASTGSDDPGLHCGAVELLLGQGSRLRFVNLQNWGHGVWHFAHQRAVLARDASLQWTLGALGSKLAKVNQHVALAGEGANSQVNGVMFTEGKQHLSYHTLQHHRAPHTKSDFLYKGRPAGSISHRVARHDQGRSRRDQDRRLPAQRQPAAFHGRPGRFDPRAGNPGR